MKNKKIFISGGTGFLGRHFIIEWWKTKGKYFNLKNIFCNFI